MKPISKHFVLVCGAIFLLALGVRFLTWQDNYRDISKVQTHVIIDYKEPAGYLLAGDFKTFVNDISHLGHPPGYSILLAAIFKVAGESDTAIQVVQILCDAVAVVVIFLIALELLPVAVAVIAALLAAVSPQFAYFSVLLLPDSLVVLPIVLAVYFIIRARKHQRLLNFVIAGVLVGLSCWFRANALLLPVFLAATAAILVDREKRLRSATAVIAGALLAIAPITIKNAIVYRTFVPVSLGTGQTLLEGIADYDEANRFNIPNTDLGIMRQEAEWHGKPEYAQALFGRDGIQRDRMRIARGLAVIKSHPLWFTGVVIRRGIDSTRLDPVPVVAPESPVAHTVVSNSDPIWRNEVWESLQGGETKYGTITSSETISVRPGHDYFFEVFLRLEEGRVLAKVTSTDGRKTLASVPIDLAEGVSAEEQPLHQLSIPFVSANESGVRLAIDNFASQHPKVVKGPARLFELGPSSYQWLRYARIPLGWVQRIFKTAVFVPLVLIGLVVMMRKSDWRTLVIILTVPAYYLIVQSTLHTERRYVYIIHFFFLLPAAMALWSLFDLLRNAKTRNTKRQVHVPEDRTLST